MEHEESRRNIRQLRTFAVVWIVLAPVVFAMAAISTVKSDLVYDLQLIAFSVVAAAAIVCGVAALFRQRWAAYALTNLSWLAALYFLGNAGVLIALAVLPSSDISATFGLVSLLALMTAMPGVPFLLMARQLRVLASRLH